MRNRFERDAFRNGGKSVLPGKAAVLQNGLRVSIVGRAERAGSIRYLGSGGARVSKVDVLRCANESRAKVEAFVKARLLENIVILAASQCLVMRSRRIIRSAYEIDRVGNSGSERCNGANHLGGVGFQCGLRTRGG